jgi:translation initiation factor 1
VLITGLPLGKAELKSLAKKLKSKCGVGGSIDGATIIIQGDKRDLLQPELESMGYKVKLSGG